MSSDTCRSHLRWRLASFTSWYRVSFLGKGANFFPFASPIYLSEAHFSAISLLFYFGTTVQFFKRFRLDPFPCQQAHLPVTVLLEQIANISSSEFISSIPVGVSVASFRPVSASFTYCGPISISPVFNFFSCVFITLNSGQGIISWRAFPIQGNREFCFKFFPDADNSLLPFQQAIHLPCRHPVFSMQCLFSVNLFTRPPFVRLTLLPLNKSIRFRVRLSDSLMQVTERARRLSDPEISVAADSEIYPSRSLVLVFSSLIIA